MITQRIIEKPILLLTGATGALGTRILENLQRAKKFEKIIILGRNEPKNCGNLPVEFIQCDIRNRDFGALLDKVFEQHPTHILHVAANVSWRMTEAASHNTNVEPVRLLLQRCNSSIKCKPRFVFVSTAYSSAPPRYTHNAMQQVRGHANFYESSKAEAEKLILSAGVPFVILKPSLILGDSVEGRISKFNGIYSIFPFICKNMVPFLIGHEKAHIDIVPVDFVANISIDALWNSALLGHSIYLTQNDAAINAEQIFEIINKRINQTKRAMNLPEIVNPSIITRDTYNRIYGPMLRKMPSNIKLRQLASISKIIEPYLVVAETFKASTNVKIPKPPTPSIFLENCISYWISKNIDTVAEKGIDWKQEQAH